MKEERATLRVEDSGRVTANPSIIR